MGKKTSSNKAAARKRFPIGELAKERQELKETFLAKNADLQINAQNNIEKVSKRVSKC
jgi:hypothetical protein